MQRRTYLFSGHVQGVGFRYTAQAIAALHAVTGYVRNLDDGRVELVVEGEDLEMDHLVQRLQDQMAGHISRTRCEPSPATGEFQGFNVRPG